MHPLHDYFASQLADKRMASCEAALRSFAGRSPRSRTWIFPNAACTTALIDRVVHHADTIAIEGESYRRREAQAAKPRRRRQV